MPISRSQGVDVFTGEGLADALSGVETVIDVSTFPTPDQDAATEFFSTAARNLHEVGERAGVQRMVGVSIVSTDKYVAGYSVAKVAHEKAMLAGPIPVQILRATQFFEFVEQLLVWTRQGDVAYLPTMRVQPVAARAVAMALADLATSAAWNDSSGTTPCSQRSPARAWRALPTLLGVSPLIAAIRCWSRKCPTPPTRTG